VDETKENAQTDSTVAHQDSTESDFMDEMKNHHDKEDLVESRPADETKGIDQTDSAIAHQDSTESNFMNEKKDFYDKEKGGALRLAEETNDPTQIDFSIDLQHPTESDFINEMKHLHDKEEMEYQHPDGYTSGSNYDQGKVCYMTKKSPFSIHVEIDDFLHAPIFGDMVQNTFDFHDLNKQQIPEFDTKLINTTEYYPEEPDYRLVCSKIHEIAFLSDAQNEGKYNKGNQDKSVIVPLHDSQITKAEEANHHSNVHIRVPVVLGEYKIEICLEENVTFIEEVMRIKEISKEVVLTNFRLIPRVYSQSLNNGTRTVLKGNLLIEGYIKQKIKYTAFPDKNTESLTPLKQLYQKMVVELIINILQVQQVLVKT
ncbi:BC_2427 family protein, partial [Gottfriedia acidiceleris]